MTHLRQMTRDQSFGAVHSLQMMSAYAWRDTMSRLTELYGLAGHNCCRGGACRTPLPCGPRFRCQVLASSAYLNRLCEIPVSASTDWLVRTFSSKMFNAATGLAFTGFCLRTLSKSSGFATNRHMATYLFFAVANTVSRLITKKALRESASHHKMEHESEAACLDFDSVNCLSILWALPRGMS